VKVSYLPTDTAVPMATDTRMLQAEISTGRLSHLGVEVFCLMDDPEVAEKAKRRNTTRAAVAASIIYALAIMALEEVPS
jgi:precorrin isomerase